MTVEFPGQILKFKKDKTVLSSPLYASKFINIGEEITVEVFDEGKK